MSNLILDHVIVSDLRNVHKRAAWTTLDFVNFMKPSWKKKKTNIKYNKLRCSLHIELRDETDNHNEETQEEDLQSDWNIC